MALFGVISLMQDKAAFESIVQQEIASGTINGTTPEQAYNLALEVGAILPLFIGVLFGLIFGVIFARIALKFLSSQTLPIRGAAFGAILWVVYEFLLGSFDVVSIVTSIGASLVAGYLLGYLYDRFAPRSPGTFQEPGWGPPNPSGIEP